MATEARRLFQQVKKGSTKRVRFSGKPSVQTFGNGDRSVMITYDSEADGIYMSENDRATLGIPILQESKRRVGVASGGTRKGKFVTRLPFPQLSPKTAEADTFSEFKTLLMSLGKTADDGNVSIFTSTVCWQTVSTNVR